MANLASPWVFLDLETTGLKPETDKIIEFGLVLCDGGERTVWGQMVNPGQLLEPFISHITGIDDEMLAKAPPLAEVREEALGFLEGVVVVAHNAAFDVNFLERQLGIHYEQAKIIDTIEMAKVLYPGLRSYSLRSLIRVFELPLLPNHRALDDALALEQIFLYMATKARRLHPSLVEQILMAFEGEDRGLTEFFTGVLLNRLPVWLEKAIEDQPTSSPADRVLPNGNTIDDGFNQFMADDLDDHLFSDSRGKRADQQEQDTARDFWNKGQMAKLLDEDGGLAQKIVNYQFRTQQKDMLESTAKAFSDSRYLMIEAPTGVGKSLAYLVPAVCWAKAFGRKVLISTHTIALQEQLFDKEIAFLRELLPFSFRCAMLKGRGNYLCLNRWREVITKGKGMVWGERILLARLAVWLAEGSKGDMDSITLLGPEREWFYQMASSRETCQASQCQYFRECFYQKARLAANSAQIIIINHALLLSGSRMGEGVLPKASHLIIDEAHHLEDEGIRYYTDTFSSLEFERKLQQLHRRRDVFGRSGFLQYIKEYKQSGLHALENLDPHLEGMEKQVKTVLKRAQTIQAMLQSTALPETFRLKPGSQRGDKLQALLANLDNLLFIAKDLKLFLDRLARILQGEDGKVFEETWLKQQLLLFQDVSNDIRLLERFLSGVDGGEPGEDALPGALPEITGACSTTVNIPGSEKPDPLSLEFPDSGEMIYWVSRDTRLKNISLCLTPLNIADCFRQYLFDGKESVVFTSATLSVNEGFDYCRQQLGIDPAILDTMILNSPFHYDEQVLLLSDKALPDPSKTAESVYNLALAESMKIVLEACGGRTMVLFTSHKQLKAMFDALHQPVGLMGLELFADGQNGSRSSLLEELRTNEKAVVFGSGMFWEGVDLPGSYLTSLIIVRLPFSPPGQPMIEARMEKLEEEGKDPFYSYSLPQAVLRFKQGYGRLIRTAEDWGVVVILDNRIINKTYGKVFLRSLPDGRCQSGSPVLLAEKIRQWRKEKNG